MTDSPSPIDSSFDASDVATPCTVIAVKTALRNRRNEQNEEEDEENTRQSLENEDVSNIYVDDYSKEFSDDESVVPSVVPTIVKPASFAKNFTKVYCFVDDEEHPYMHEVHVPPDQIILGDVKRKLGRTNFKYYCIALDPESGLEVKAEIRDDSRRLYPLKNGRFELYLLTIEGSTHSDASSGRNRKKVKNVAGGGSMRMTDYQRAAYQFDNCSAITSDSESQVSLPTYVKKAQAFNRRQGHPQPPPPSIYDRLPHLKPGGGSSRHHHHHQNPHHHQHQRHQNHYEDSTFDITEDSEFRNGETFYDEDDDDKRSINTDLTSISQQHMKQKWRAQQQKEMQKRNKWRTQPSMSTTSSSFSSLTESSMGLEVITVRLNLESMPLGMVPSGHTNARGDAGLYVGDIHPRGAVALDGRIDIGDMIVEINEQSLSSYTNREAVELLKRAVQRQFVTLTVAKTGQHQRAPLRNPRQEPSRPLDPNEWMKHANAAMKAMPSISEEHSSSTPIPDEWPTNSSASGTPFGGPHPVPQQLTVHTDKKYIVEMMALPGSGLDIKDHVWMKIPFPMSFWGENLVKWLKEHVADLPKSKAAEFAAEMMKLGYIKSVFDKKKFSDKSYYVMGEECADYTQLRAPDGGYKYPPSQTSSLPSGASESANNNIFPASMYPPQLPPKRANGGVQQSMVSGYASMPASPFPAVVPMRDSGRTRDDQRSQTSGSSKSSSRRYVELPKKTSSVGSGSVTDSISENRVASRSSFRAAMSGSHRNFSIDG